MDYKEIENSVVIEAEFIHENEKSYLMDCEGDERWFPKKEVNVFRDRNELEIPVWLAKRYFPNENF